MKSRTGRDLLYKEFYCWSDQVNLGWYINSYFYLIFLNFSKKKKNKYIILSGFTDHIVTRKKLQRETEKKKKDNIFTLCHTHTYIYMDININLARKAYTVTACPPKVYRMLVAPVK